MFGLAYDGFYGHVFVFFQGIKRDGVREGCAGRGGEGKLKGEKEREKRMMQNVDRKDVREDRAGRGEVRRERERENNEAGCR